MKIVGSKRVKVDKQGLESVGLENSQIQNSLLNQYSELNNKNTNVVENENTKPRSSYTHEYLLDNGQIINVEQAYDMAKQGLIEGVTASTNQGVKYIRSVGDGDKTNNLVDLPEF